MKNYIKKTKNISAIMGIMFIMIGAGLADNEKLLPTLVFVGLGAVMVLIHKQIEKSEEEEI